MSLVPHWLDRYLLGFLLCACLSCGAMPRTAQRGRSPWREITTPHFRMSTNVPIQRGLEIARQLEELETAMLALAWPKAKHPPGRTEVVVFRDLQDVASTVGDAAGAMLRGPSLRSTLVFGAPTHADVPTVAAHEIAHQLSHWFMPVQPPWLAEGLASYLQTVRYDRATRSGMMGAPPLFVLHRYQQHGDALVSASVRFLSTWSEHDTADKGLDYARAWLLVHYLITQRSENFARFQKQLSYLADAAWDRELSDVSTSESLQEDLEEHWRTRASWAEVHVQKPVRVGSFSPAVKDLRDAAAHGLIALVLAKSGRNVDALENELRHALSLDATELNALTVRFYSKDSDSARKAMIAKTCIDTHPNEPVSWMMAADVATALSEKMGALRRALALDPFHPGVHQRIALAEIEAGNPARALKHTTLALRQSAVSAVLLGAHALALAANGQCAQARVAATNRVPSFSAEERRAMTELVRAIEPACPRR